MILLYRLAGRPLQAVPQSSRKMTEDHSIPTEVLHRFIARTATTEERRAVVRHLLAGCSSCRRYLDGFWPGRKQGNVVPLFGANYDRAFERAERVIPVLTGHHPTCELLTELGSHPPDRQELLVRNHQRYWRMELCDDLILAASRQRFGNTRQLVHRARLAVIVAENLKPGKEGGAARVEDYRSRAWSEFANSLRISGDLTAADKAFSIAQAHRLSGTGDPSHEARFLSKLASLRSDQRRFGTSLQLSRQASTIWRTLNDRQELGRALMAQASATGEAGYPEMALKALSEAGSLVEHDTDSQLIVFLQHNTIRFLSESGSTRMALRLYENIRRSYGKASAPLIRSKGLWLEGQLLSAAGETDAALQPLTLAREELLAHESSFEAALVSLDLASALGKLGRRQEMRRLAAATFHEMVARRVRREAFAALILLRNSA